MKQQMARWTQATKFNNITINKLIKNAPFKILGGGGWIKKCWRGDQLEHTCKPHTDGQLIGYMPVTMRWRTRHGSTEAETARQCAILSLAGSQNLCQTMTWSCTSTCTSATDPHEHLLAIRGLLYSGHLAVILSMSGERLPRGGSTMYMQSFCYRCWEILIEDRCDSTLPCNIYSIENIMYFRYLQHWVTDRIAPQFMLNIMLWI